MQGSITFEKKYKLVWANFLCFEQLSISIKGLKSLFNVAEIAFYFVGQVGQIFAFIIRYIFTLIILAFFSIGRKISPQRLDIWELSDSMNWEKDQSSETGYLRVIINTLYTLETFEKGYL